MSVDCDTFSKAFRAWAGEFKPDVDSGRLTDEENLFDAGVLDSFTVVSVVMFVEEFRGAELELESTGIESFSSINRIYAEFIEGRG